MYQTNSARAPNSPHNGYLEYMIIVYIEPSVNVPNANYHPSCENRIVSEEHNSNNPSGYTYNQNNHPKRIESHRSHRKEDLYPITTQATQQQRTDTTIDSQTRHSLFIEPHPSIHQAGHPQRIPSLYSPLISPSDVAYFSSSPFQQQLTPHSHSQHSSSIEPHPSVVKEMQYGRSLENIQLTPSATVSSTELYSREYSQRINLHPSNGQC